MFTTVTSRLARKNMLEKWTKTFSVEGCISGGCSHFDRVPVYQLKTKYSTDLNEVKIHMDRSVRSFSFHRKQGAAIFFNAQPNKSTKK